MSLHFEMNRPARRDNELTERLSFGKVGEFIFRDLDVVPVIQGRRDGCWLQSLQTCFRLELLVRHFVVPLDTLDTLSPASAARARRA